MTTKFDVEVTDTFGGEANYCWVHRHVINAADAVIPATAEDRRRDRRKLVRAAKALEGWAGIRCTVDDSGDLITVRPRGACMVMFISWRDPSSDAPEAADDAAPAC